MLAVPFAKHVADVVVFVGVDGTVNCAEILNNELAADEHEPLLAVTV
jgi:predicted polyphosphate/ATP-dependent NAD kinase